MIGNTTMSEKKDYDLIAYNFDKGVAHSWDRMVEDTKDLFREHCENREELEEFYDEISGYKNASSLTADLFQIAYERLIEEDEDFFE